MCRTTTQKNKTSELKEGEEWIKTFDINAFRSDIKTLGDKLEAEQAERNGDYERVAELRYARIKELETQLRDKEKMIKLNQ